MTLQSCIFLARSLCEIYLPDNYILSCLYIHIMNVCKQSSLILSNTVPTIFIASLKVVCFMITIFIYYIIIIYLFFTMCIHIVHIYFDGFWWTSSEADRRYFFHVIVIHNCFRKLTLVNNSCHQPLDQLASSASITRGWWVRSWEQIPLGAWVICQTKGQFISACVLIHMFLAPWLRW